MKSLEKFLAVFEAEMKAYVREAGPLVFMASFPFFFSLLTYGVGSVLSEGQASPRDWFFQLIGFSVMTISITMASATAWYFRRGMITGRLEYTMAAPVNPIIIALASSLAHVAVALMSFIVVGFVGVLSVYGAAHLLNLTAALLLVFIALLPVVGINLVVGTLTIVMKEPEPISSTVSAVAAATSGFVYPITMLPTLLQLVGKTLPYFYVVETARSLIDGYFEATQLTNIFLMLAYLALGLAVYRLGENYYARKVGVHW
ncbi:MAG: ABC transporter permease [Candidatus Caldarchaeum sp.]|nr:ABC transporter permease [Candidatus Caldarchaeum sp.]MDW8359010.1 ABC transporter permease [Candidatus Caldarchaeum sp.]